MILISHRGNLDSIKPNHENQPYYIQAAIDAGYQVEIDIWKNHSGLHLGHDSPQYPIDIDWLEDKSSNLWIHCKNIAALEFLSSKKLHYFWHQTDTVTLTSQGHIWAYPSNQPIVNSIAVLPELHNETNLSQCYGICSDNITKYKYLL